MCASLTLSRRAAFLACFFCFCMVIRPATGQVAQWRGLWVDCLHIGLKSTAQIDALVQRAAQGNYNVIVAEVMAYQDNGTSGHGAYWNSAIIPKAPDIVGGIDPLAYLCQKAGEQNIQVHAWLVAYRVSSSWPPSGNAFLAAHPEYLMVPRAGIDSDPVVTIGGHYILDPGSPDVQNYLVNIARELVSNYPIHGINWDYIRYTQTDAGYPARSSYDNSGLRRYQRIYDRPGIPLSNDSLWSEFRRRTLSELVRRCRAEIPDIRDNPNQPVMQTVDGLAAGSAPSSFTSSLAFTYFQNWKLWAESGWIDALVPMNYKRDHCSNEYTGYRSWVDRIVLWKGPRHAYCGQATYLNSFANSVTQMQYVFSKGHEGACNYSYVGTRSINTICDGNDDWTSDWAWYPYAGSTIYSTPAVPPSLPWRHPATATEGTVWGRVFDHATGLPIDDAAVTVYGRPAVRTDGNGYYTVTLVPATAEGMLYLLTVAKIGYPTLSYPGAKVLAGDLVRYDFALGAPPPQIVLSTDSLTQTVNAGQPVLADSFTVSAAAGGGILNYTVSQDVDWLSVSPVSGVSYGQEDTITVSYEIAGLARGTYHAIITVADVAATNNPQTVSVTLVLPKPCDFDLDGDVDQDDFAYLQACLTGDGIPVTDPDCLGANLDGDSDVDGDDVQLFLGCMSGAGTPSDPNCLP